MEQQTNEQVLENIDSQFILAAGDDIVLFSAAIKAMDEWASIKCGPLIDALTKINQMSDPGSSAKAVIDIKNIAHEVLSQYNEGVPKGWYFMELAPKDGSTIEVSYDKEGKETCYAMWSKRRVCMGNVCERKPEENQDNHE